MQSIIPIIVSILLIFNTLSAIAADVIADKVVIEKRARKLTLFAGGKPLKIFKVALGRNPDGPKERESDNKTPEGDYTIDSRNNKSRYHLSLHISYPESKDIQRAKTLGKFRGHHTELFLDWKRILN